MAEAIARQLGGASLEVCSAGLAPTGVVSERALEVLRRRGYPTGGLRSKGLDEVSLEEMDVVVSLLGRDGLRMLGRPGGRRFEAWPVRDPYGEDLRIFEAVARDLERRIRPLVEELKGREPRLP